VGRPVLMRREPAVGGPVWGASDSSAEAAFVAMAVLVLIIVTFFVRGHWFGPAFGSVTYILPGVAAFLLAVFIISQLWRAGAVALPPAPYLLLALVSALNLTINGVFVTAHVREVALFAGEVGLNSIVFLVAYNLGRPGPHAVDRVLRLVQWAGILSTVILAGMLVSADSFSRLSFAATGVNHLGHALAILVMVSLYRALMEIRRSRYLHAAGSMIALLGALFFLILSGTRSAMAGLVLALLVLVWLRGRRREVVLLYPALAIASFALIVVFVRSDAFGRLLRRFDTDSIALGIGSRVEQWGEVISVSTTWSAAFGAPWLYEAIAVSPPVYPHNMLLSVGLYMGLLPLALILWILGTRLLRLYVHSRRARADLLSASLLGVLLIALMYASLSGLFTRVLTTVFLLGLVEGWLQYPKSSERPQLTGKREAATR
jgi:O-antigen ligase